MAASKLPTTEKVTEGEKLVTEDASDVAGTTMSTKMALTTVAETTAIEKRTLMTPPRSSTWITAQEKKAKTPKTPSTA